MDGYINLYRQILDSAVFASEKRLKLWIWLLCKANYKDRFVSLNIGRGESVIELKRGQVLFGRFKAEEETGIDGSTIYKILQWFENENMITIKSNTHYTVLTVCNYDTFNTFESEKVAANEQQTNSQVAANEQPSNTPKQVKKEKKEEKEYPPELIELNEKCKKYFDEKYINEKSLDCFDKLIRINGYTIKDIQSAILNARSEPFWDDNFLSPLKLREKDKNGVLFIDRFLKINKKTQTNKEGWEYGTK